MTLELKSPKSGGRAEVIEQRGDISTHIDLEQIKKALEPVINQRFVENDANNKINRPEEYKRITESIQSIDFGFLLKVLRKIFIKSGVDIKNINFNENTKVFIRDKDVKDETNLAGFDSPVNCLYVNIDVKDIKTGDRTELSNTDFIKLVLHEIGHSVVMNYIKFIITPSQKGYGVDLDTDVRIGYQEFGHMGERYFVWIDEPIIDLLADILLIKILRESGHKDAEIFQEVVKVKKPYYKQKTNFFLGMLDSLSERSTTSKEELWNAFIRGIINGEQMTITEYFEILEQEFGIGFVERIKMANTNEEFIKIAEDFGFEDKIKEDNYERWLEEAVNKQDFK